MKKLKLLLSKLKKQPKQPAHENKHQNVSEEIELESKEEFQKNVPCQEKEPNFDGPATDNTKEDVVKYLQILLYCVQDASLFKVFLPSQDQQDAGVIVKILQFSPEVLTTVYKNVSDLCFSFETSAITKILFISLFGPCVMLFIFILYLCQKLISGFLAKSGKAFKARLVQTFLLVVLFLYQKMVWGAFTLIQCVDIGATKVLYVGGGIECYTWWQRASKIYIVLNITPGFFALSIIPVHVEAEKLSVRAFILSCLFPVPVAVINVGFRQLVKSLKKGQKSGANKIQNNADVQVGHKESISETEGQFSLDTLGEAQVLTSDSYTDIGGKYSTEVAPVQTTNKSRDGRRCQKEKTETKSKAKLTDSRQAITDILLKHYRPLKLFDITFTWLGVHKLYRVGLVG